MRKKIKQRNFYATTDFELELRQQLSEAGKQLSNPPASDDELLHILDLTEKLLAQVDQSPNTMMMAALLPSMEALVNENLLKHSDVDVKIAVAACLSEITRITAPDLPYSDEEMKDVFRLIVSSVENLWDASSRSYGKKSSILETLYKVRSCVMLLDLECNLLIVEMFEHFFKSVRGHHLIGSIFSWMMNIMVHVLEQSEDISIDMLKPLLASIENNSEGVLPVARKLGETVLQESAAKVRPNLIKTLRIMGVKLENYSPVLASICEDVVEHNAENAENKLAKESSNDAPQAQEKSLSEDDGMDITLQSALKTATGEGKLEEAVATGSKRKQVSGEKVSESIKYDDSLVGVKVKVWWPEDKVYYDGVIIECFDSKLNKYKVLYENDEIEILNLKTEKWEIVRAHTQETDDLNVKELEDEDAAETARDDKGCIQESKKKLKWCHFGEKYF